MRRSLQTTAAAALIFGAMLWHGSIARATSVQQYDLGRLFAESALVVRAHVLESTGYARDMAANGVCTELRLQVMEVLAGQWDTNEALIFCLPGGVTSAGKMQMVLSAPMPREGDTYVLFIRGGPWSYTPFVNWYYGAMREERVQGQTVLVTGSGDCVLSVGNSYVELGARLADEDQVRHLNALGVDVAALMSTPVTRGTVSTPVGGNGVEIGSQRSNQCATSSTVMSTLRQRANARAATQSLKAAGAPALEAFHTPIEALLEKAAQ
jgi:hypothetical protein